MTRSPAEQIELLHREHYGVVFATAFWWLAAGESFQEVEALHARVLVRGPAAYLG